MPPPSEDQDSPEKELTSYEPDRDLPFKGFSSISDNHGDVNTTLPHYFRKNPEDEDYEDIRDLSSEFRELDSFNTKSPLASGDVFGNEEIASDVDVDVDDVPSPAHTPSDLHSLSPSNGDSSLLVRSIDQRFHTRLSSLTSVRSLSSNISTSSSINYATPGNPNRSTVFTFDDENLLLEEANSNPWEVMRWSKLRKISSQIFSDTAQATYGKPTCILAAAHIVLGMSHGQVLVFDYHQVLQAVLGANTKAIESGKVTALAVSADFSYIASGYSTGHIFTWDLAKPTTPNIHIRPLSKSALLKTKHADGHAENTPVIYLNFVGKRHSALVSGDVSGMAFAHDTTRSVVGRVVHTKRILGRYSTPSEPSQKRKPTTLLACSPLPLGSAQQPTDKICLVAIMTPYLLAIVSVLPRPQTEFKTGRPKTVTSEMGLSGCLAWLPALKSTSPGIPDTNARLAYSWSNVVTVMEVNTSKSDANSNKSRVSLDFRFVNRFVGNEAIVSIQWLSRQVIALVTSTQRLILLNEETMVISATVDLLNKHIYHLDMFSSILKDLTLIHPDTQELQPVVVCDAYFNSVRSFKGKLFLLGNYELVVGSLSNWADRLLDTMQMGDYIGAIDLATNYYLGNQDLAIVSLPSNDDERHSIVIKNLPEMILASVKYTFNGPRTTADETHTWEDMLRELCETCLHAWVSIDKPDDLLEEVFELFQQNDFSLLFFGALIPLVSNGQVTYLPPTIFGELVKSHVSDPKLANRLEEVICSLDIETLDLDTAITLSKEHHLKDTLIYIWNRALDDYITPLVEFIQSITELSHKNKRSVDLLSETEKVYPYISYILSGRVYPTGLAFQDQQIAAKARSCIYYTLFSSTNMAWPQGGPVIFTKDCNRDDEPVYPYLTLLIKFNTPAFFAALNEAFEDPFLNDGEDIRPHILPHDEDPISSSPSGTNSLDEALVFGNTVNRQLIINILLEVFTINNKELNECRIFLDIFISRNYPKYSQFIILPGNVLTQVLNEVSNCAYPQLKEECELSLEALLSKFKPYDLDNVIRLLEEVKFYSVLQFVYRGERRYDGLLRASLNLWKENDKSDAILGSKLMDIVAEAFRNTRLTLSAPTSSDTVFHNGSIESKIDGIGETASKKQRKEIDHLIGLNFKLFAEINTTRLVKIISNYSPQLHENVFKLADPITSDCDKEETEDQRLQYKYLDSLFSLISSKSGQYIMPDIRYRHWYIKLLCAKGKRNKLFKLFKNTLTGSDDVDLGEIRHDLVKCGAIDSLVMVLRRQNKNLDALNAVIERLRELNHTGVAIENGSGSVTKDHADDALDKVHREMRKYLDLGVEICNDRDSLFSKTTTNVNSSLTAADETGISTPPLKTVSSHLDLRTVSEKLWVTLLDSIVEITRSEEQLTTPSKLESEKEEALKNKKHSSFTPNILQTALSALLDKSGTRFDNATIVRICSALLTPIDEDDEESKKGTKDKKSRTIGSLRPILHDLFSAYRYQQNVLVVAKQLLDEDTYFQLCQLIAARSKGWKIAASGECEGCGKPVVGLGIEAESVYKLWERKTKRIKKGEQFQDQVQCNGDGVIGARDRSSTLNDDNGYTSMLERQKRLIEKGKLSPSEMEFFLQHMKKPGLIGIQDDEPEITDTDLKAIVQGQQRNERKDILVVFKCSHAYHLGCLRNLGVKGPLKCIIDN